MEAKIYLYISSHFFNKISIITLKSNIAQVWYISSRGDNNPESFRGWFEESIAPSGARGDRFFKPTEKTRRIVITRIEIYHTDCNIWFEFNGCFTARK